MDEEKKIIQLKNMLEHHNKKYYQDSMPEITDDVYDTIKKEYIDLLTKFPQYGPYVPFGSNPSKNFKKIKHKSPMLSLNNAFSTDDVNKFMDRIKRFLNMQKEESIELIAEYKIDGVSFALHYINGILKTALTRGNGEYGEDITKNILSIKDIPHFINGAPENLEVRGEIFFDHESFNEFSQFSNPRNAASGSLRQLNSSAEELKKLRYFMYTLHCDSEIKTQEESLKFLQEFGFKINTNYLVSSNIDEIVNFHQQVYNQRALIGYDIDGVVYKVNYIDLQNRLGFTMDAPRWAIAHKFCSQEAKTVIEKIVFSVGRTGVITPIANLKPINIGGVIVSRANLHNKDEISKKDIREGDTVIVKRSGDVIPYVICVDMDSRTAQLPTEFPLSCPVCNTTLIQEEKESAIKCPAEMFCKAQLLHKIKYMLTSLEIMGIGEEQLNFFITNNMISEIPDIFDIAQHKEQIMQHKGWGIKSVEKLILAIDSIKEVKLEKFIMCLGVASVGHKTAELLAEEFVSFEEWYKNMQRIRNSDAIKERVKNICGLGESLINSLERFFSQTHNLEMIDKISKKIIIKDFESSNSMLLAGKNIVFTGKMRLSRPEIKEKAKTLGAKISDKVSKNTNILVIGEKPTESKIEDANKLGITIMSEAEWEKYLIFINS